MRRSFRIRISRIAVFIALGLTSLPLNGLLAQQKNPSLGETLTWLEQQIRVATYRERILNETYSVSWVADHSDCTLDLTERYEHAPSWLTPWRVSHVGLASIDVNKLEFIPYAAKHFEGGVQVGGPYYSVGFVGTFNSERADGSTYPGGAVVLVFRDSTLGQRVVRALGHAIRLCKAKEPF